MYIVLNICFLRLHESLSESEMCWPIRSAMYISDKYSFDRKVNIICYNISYRAIIYHTTLLKLNWNEIAGILQK